MKRRDTYSPRDKTVWLAMNGLSWAAETAPWEIWQVAADGVATIAMGLPWRRPVLANVRHVRGDRDCSEMSAWLTGSRQIATHLMTLVSAIRGIDQLAEGDIEIEGWEHLQLLLGQRGIVVVAPHCGSYPVLGMVMARRLRQLGFGGQIATMLRLFQPFGSHAVIDWFQERLESQGLTVIATDAKPSSIARQLHNTLRRRGIVILFVDEPSDTTSLPVPFFDDEIQMPVGPARLARASGAVILPCCAVFEPGERHRLIIGEPIEPTGSDQETLEAVAHPIESFIERYLDQWSMLSPIWHRRNNPNIGLADLHLHTRASDGLLEVSDWTAAMVRQGIDVIAITDHDHLASIARAKRRGVAGGDRVIPGVEITARGRAVHVGVLFPEQLPDHLIPAGRPISEVVRWARAVQGSIVVLVHPLPLLWRYQLWRLGRDNLLPDAMEIAFPLAGWRSRRLDRAAKSLNIARLGGSDGHLSVSQLGTYATRFPGETVDDLITAIRGRTTEPVFPEPGESGGQASLKVYVQQCAYSWLLPFQRYPTIRRTRQTLLERVGTPKKSRTYACSYSHRERHYAD